MKWFYSTLGTGNHSVKQSEAIHDSEAAALADASALLKNNQASVQTPSYPNEVLSVTTGRK